MDVRPEWKQKKNDIQYSPLCGKRQGTERTEYRQKEMQARPMGGDLKRRQSRKRRQKRLRRKLCLLTLWVCALLTFLVAVGIWGIGKIRTSRAAEQAGMAGDEGEAQGNAVPESAESDAVGAGIGAKQEPLPFDPEDPLLILVNKEYGLPEDYNVELRTLNSWPVSVAEVLYEDLQDMLTDGKAEGLHFVVCSAYRSPKRQQELLDEDIRACMASGMSYADAYDEVTRQTMPPGHSEHSTGLALDIVARDYQLLDEGQERTAECQWLQKNAWKYGFILRYPEEKEEITGIDYESWHFRYVGKEAAKYMYDNGLTLEELLLEEF